MPTDQAGLLHNLKTEVEAELLMAEASHPEQAYDKPVEQWLFDPTDVERQEVRLRNLLDAIKALLRPRTAGQRAVMVAVDPDQPVPATIQTGRPAGVNSNHNPGSMRAMAAPTPPNFSLQESAAQPHQPTHPTLLDSTSHHERHHASARPTGRQLPRRTLLGDGSLCADRSGADGSAAIGR